MPSSKPIKPWVGALVVAGVALVTVGPAMYRGLVPAKVAATEIPRSATVAELVADYRRNEVGADREWRGHRVQLAAVVVDVRKDILDKPYVMLGTKRSDLDGVQCLLVAGQEGRAASLDKGDHVTFRGRVGGLTLGSVMLDDCVWVN